MTDDTILRIGAAFGVVCLIVTVLRLIAYGVGRLLACPPWQCLLGRHQWKPIGVRGMAVCTQKQCYASKPPNKELETQKQFLGVELQKSAESMKQLCVRIAELDERFEGCDKINGGRDIPTDEDAIKSRLDDTQHWMGCLVPRGECERCESTPSAILAYAIGLARAALERAAYWRMKRQWACDISDHLADEVRKLSNDVATVRVAELETLQRERDTLREQVADMAKDLARLRASAKESPDACLDDYAGRFGY